MGRGSVERPAARRQRAPPQARVSALRPCRSPLRACRPLVVSPSTHGARSRASVRLAAAAPVVREHPGERARLLVELNSGHFSQDQLSQSSFTATSRHAS